jgi:hypothetical protein
MPVTDRQANFQIRQLFDIESESSKHSNSKSSKAKVISHPTDGGDFMRASPLQIPGTTTSTAARRIALRAYEIGPECVS